MGGYQKPSKPAPVSGPGKFAKRTDGGPAQPQRIAPGGAYGDRKDMAELQTSAPMAAAPKTPTASQEGLTQAPVQVTPFGAPSERPNEPVTHGAASGPGAGPEALGLPTQNPDLLAWKQKYLPVVAQLALSAETPDTIKNLYRFLRGAG